MRVIAIDPGDKRIGVAISDPTGTISRPLTVIMHEARAKDAQTILKIAEENQVALIVVGWALDSEGEVGYRARKSKRLAEVLQDMTDIPVEMWDESGTTQAAIQSRIEMGLSRKKRQGHLDDVAASILLQDYLINHEEIVKKED